MCPRFLVRGGQWCYVASESEVFFNVFDVVVERVFLEGALLKSVFRSGRQRRGRNPEELVKVLHKSCVLKIALSRDPCDRVVVLSFNCDGRCFEAIADADFVLECFFLSLLQFCRPGKCDHSCI
ncbi:hypothetical protein TNIN_136061 [Trichonephila inaurata madagascariensis]|uniref:Uncharacterized protein n=1 Tax=Trichonephila inaurata madagascariensis TaxID=2747483 RepID=A0A8X6XE32_9ARAC|nr:hypothetical protein TNIN_136061 [Trichonephila inaurata madagascariensis]